MAIGINSINVFSTGDSGVLYLDESGGYLDLLITARGYTSTHKLHVNPYNPAGGAYSAVASGQETNVIETASNLVALLEPLYTASDSIQAGTVFQTTPDHTSAQPTALDMSAAAHAGSGSGGTQATPWIQTAFVAHGVDFSRWQLRLLGCNDANWGSGGRISYLAGSATTAQRNLAEYLLGSAAGPGLSGVGAGLTTQIVTHAGEKLAPPLFIVYSMNKRVRRRFGVL